MLSGETTATTPATPSPCGIRAAAPPRYHHVVWIWMENHTYAAVIGRPAAPYQTTLARQCGSATNYATVGAPSLPNYVGATAGSTFGMGDDSPPASHPISADNLFREVRLAGGSERSYVESMPANCSLNSHGEYAVKHNPAAYFAAPGDRAACNADDVPLGTTSAGALASALDQDSLPTFAFIIPNLCNDTHDCSVATGDAWLRSWLPRILASPAYVSGGTAVVLAYDEYTALPNVFIGMSVSPGVRVTGRVDHYALLRATEEMLGLHQLLGAAAGAPDLRPALNL